MYKFSSIYLSRLCCKRGRRGGKGGLRLINRRHHLQLINQLQLLAKCLTTTEKRLCGMDAWLVPSSVTLVNLLDRYVSPTPSSIILAPLCPTTVGMLLLVYYTTYTIYYLCFSYRLRCLAQLRYKGMLDLFYFFFFVVFTKTFRVVYCFSVSPSRCQNTQQQLVHICSTHCNTD